MRFFYDGVFFTQNHANKFFQIIKKHALNRQRGHCGDGVTDNKGQQRRSIMPDEPRYLSMTKFKKM